MEDIPAPRKKLAPKPLIRCLLYTFTQIACILSIPAFTFGIVISFTWMSSMHIWSTGTPIVCGIGIGLIALAWASSLVIWLIASTSADCPNCGDRCVEPIAGAMDSLCGDEWGGCLRDCAMVPIRKPIIIRKEIVSCVFHAIGIVCIILCVGVYGVLVFATSKESGFAMGTFTGALIVILPFLFLVVGLLMAVLWTVAVVFQVVRVVEMRKVLSTVTDEGGIFGAAATEGKEEEEEDGDTDQVIGDDIELLLLADEEEEEQSQRQKRRPMDDDDPIKRDPAAVQYQQEEQDPTHKGAMKSQQQPDEQDSSSTTVVQLVSPPPPSQTRPENISICVRCSDQERSVLVMPCQHLCLCSECAVSAQTCPLCNTPIVDRIAKSFA